MTGKATAIPWLAFNHEFGAVPFKNMFDDSQTESNASFFATTPGINSEKPLRESRNVLGFDADPRIDNSKFGTVSIALPRHCDGAIFRCVTECI